MSIDYEKQFKSITLQDAAVMANGWKRVVRQYHDAKTAYLSAKRSESRGLSVAFAEVDGLYYVWTGETT